MKLFKVTHSGDVTFVRGYELNSDLDHIYILDNNSNSCEGTKTIAVLSNDCNVMEVDRDGNLTDENKKFIQEAMRTPIVISEERRGRYPMDLSKDEPIFVKDKIDAYIKEQQTPIKGV